VEEEMLALHPVSEGVMCRRCLGHTEDTTPQELVMLGASQLVQEAAASLASTTASTSTAISTWVTEQGLDSREAWLAALATLHSRLRQSPAWLDLLLAATVAAWVVAALARGLLQALL